MHIEELGGRRYACFEKLRELPGLVHAFSMRGQDVGMRVDARSAERTARRRLMAADWGLDGGRLCCCVQVHKGRIAVVDQPDAPSQMEGYDGLVTNVVGRGLMTFSADCPLVLVYDPQRRVVGMVHASWRCTVTRITQRVVELMAERFGCLPGSLHAGIGPSAGPERYEVKQDVYEAAAGLPDREACFPRRDGRMFFDLWRANRAQLREAGVPDERIETAGVCTMSNPEMFYSFRNEGPGCGHFGLLAGLCEESAS